MKGPISKDAVDGSILPIVLTTTISEGMVEKMQPSGMEEVLELEKSDPELSFFPHLVLGKRS